VLRRGIPISYVLIYRGYELIPALSRQLRVAGWRLAAGLTARAAIPSPWILCARDYIPLRCVSRTHDAAVWINCDHAATHHGLPCQEQCSRFLQNLHDNWTVTLKTAHMTHGGHRGMLQR